MPVNPVKPIGNGARQVTQSIAQQAHQKWVEHFNASTHRINVSNVDDVLVPYKPSRQIGHSQVPDFISEIDMRFLKEAYSQGDLKKADAIKKELDIMV